MSRPPSEDVVAFLSFSGGLSDRAGAIGKFNRRAWTRLLQWLDDSGLAFYFLKKLKDSHTTSAVPPWVRSRLENSFQANHARVDHMSRRFGLINSRFNDAGVRYVVVKGFSLVPEYCPDAPLRHQGDFDYLVEGSSVRSASRVLLDAGYVAKASRSIHEWIFVSPGGAPSRSGRQYSPQAPHAVELHTDLWDSGLHGVPSIPNLFSVDRARTREWNGLAFPALADEDAFLVQVVHACHHVFTLWIRMSCFFEIACFLASRASDTGLWNRIEERVGESLMLREFVVIASELAAQLFAAPLPSLIRTWGASLRPAARIWMTHYAHRWAFVELPVYQFSLFPRSKLAQFLRQQFQGGSLPMAARARHDSYRTSRLARAASSLRKQPSLILNTAWWNQQMFVRRGIFQALASARYFCEIPRWQWLNRTGARSVTDSLSRQVREGSLESDPHTS